MPPWITSADQGLSLWNGYVEQNTLWYNLFEGIGLFIFLTFIEGEYK